MVKIPAAPNVIGTVFDNLISTLTEIGGIPMFKPRVGPYPIPELIKNLLFLGAVDWMVICGTWLGIGEDGRGLGIGAVAASWGAGAGVGLGVGAVTASWGVGAGVGLGAGAGQEPRYAVPKNWLYTAGI